MIGTWYFWSSFPPGGVTLRENEFNNCISQIQQLLPGANIAGDEICFVHLGLIPVVPNLDRNGFELEHHNSLIDHSRYGGPDGVASVMGVKYTTARSVAAKTVNYISRKIGKSINPQSVKTEPLIGGDIESLDKFLQAKKKSNECHLSERTRQHLVLNYGTKYDEIVELIYANNELGKLVPGSSEAIKAELLYCIKNEYAYNLSDLLLRRTDIGSLKKPSEETINFCVSFMGKEIGWSESEKQNQINSLLKYYDRHSVQ
jgi:glycerol-3-phosphate dehydrogenase